MYDQYYPTRDLKGTLRVTLQELYNTSLSYVKG